MIWRLLKIDPVWRFAWWLAPVGVPLGVYAKTGGVDAIMTTAPMIGLAVTMTQRATLFTAALPVPARRLFLARVFANLAMIWLPCLVAILTAAALGRFVEAMPVIAETAALITLPMAITFSLRPREFSAPIRQMVVIAILLAIGTIAAIVNGTGGAVAAVSAVISVVLFVRTWLVLPGSFQTAPVEARGKAARHRRARAPAIVWDPVLRSLFPPIAIGFLPMLFLESAPDLWVWSAIMTVFPFQLAITRSQWALALPIRRRPFLAAVFAICAAPAWLGYALNVLVFFPAAPRTARSIVLNAATLVAVQLMFASGAIGILHHRFAHLPGAMRHSLSLLVFAPIAVLGFGTAFRGGEWSNDLMRRLFAAISEALPSDLLGVTGVGAAAVVMLFWIACRLFAGIEVPNIRQLTMGEMISRR